MPSSSVNTQTAFLIHIEISKQFLAMFRENLGDDGDFFLAVCIIQTEEKNTGIGGFMPMNVFAESLVHRYDQSLFSHGDCQNVVVTHAGIQVTYRNHVIAVVGQPLFGKLADTDIHQDFKRLLTPLREGKPVLQK